MDADVKRWLENFYAGYWAKDAVVIDESEWRYRILIYKTNGDTVHYLRRFTQQHIAIRRAKELMKGKGIKKVEVLPRGLAVFKKEVITIE